MGYTTNAYKILIGNLEAKRPLWKPRWAINESSASQMRHEVGLGDCTVPAPVNTIMNLRGTEKLSASQEGLCSMQLVK
jgi:hypothetical protein